MRRACTLSLPSCKDTGHTLASLEHTCGPSSALRHELSRAEALPVTPCVHFSGYAQEAFLHHLCLSTEGVLLWASTTVPFPLLFPPLALS